MNFTERSADSTAEYLFYTRNNFLLPTQQAYYPDTFEDSNGHNFSAKPDFIYESKIYVEFKCCQLNNMRSQEHASQRYSSQTYRLTALNRRKIELDTRWSHSRFKQGIVARAYPGCFLLVFKDCTKLSTQAINRMNEEQISWCFEAEMLKTLQDMHSRLTIH